MPTAGTARKRACTARHIFCVLAPNTFSVVPMK
jgi:hypothetical protein